MFEKVLYTILHMHRTRSPRSQTIRLAIVYTTMTVVVLVALTILLLFVQGYRFNANDRSLEQGGLIQFESKPGGATITFDNQTLTRKTSTRLAAASGSHTIVMSRDGYRPWQKTITVEPGVVHWLDYTLLIPRDLKPEVSFSYDNIDQSLAAYGENKLAILPDDAKSRIDIVDASSSQPRRQTIEVPVRLINSDDESPTVKATLVTWDKSANNMLVKVRINKTTHWLVINTRDPAQSVNISSLFSSNKALSQVVFDVRSSKHVYVLSDGALHRVAFEDGVVSEPITTRVAEISQNTRGIISFTTQLDKETGGRSTGYYSPGAEKVKILEEYLDDGKPDLRVRIGEYFGDQYVVTQYDNTVEVDKVSLHPSDDDQDLALTNITTIDLEDGIEYLDFSPRERFIVAQHKASYTTYDLELMKVDTATVRGESAVTTQFAWLDDFHLWSNRDDELRIYEFDGENGSRIGAMASNQVPLLTKSGKYLYYVGPVEDGRQSLLQVQLLP